MVCDHCGLVWDFGDPDPPPCQIAITNERAKRSNFTIDVEPAVEPGDHDEEMQKIKRMLDDENI